MLSLRLNSRSASSTQVSSTTAISSGRSISVVLRPSVMGLTNRVTPSTSPTLAIFEPRALPTASSPEPARADIIEMRISGAEVPTDTMVSPISMGVRPARLAIAEAPSTKRSALHTKATSPAAITAEYHNTILFPYSRRRARGFCADRVLCAAAKLRESTFGISRAPYSLT